jgi:cyanate permease
MQIMQDRGLDTAAGLAGLKADLMQLCTNLVTPLIAARPTAAQAWDAVQVLCAKHGVAIPPAEPMLG